MTQAHQLRNAPRLCMARYPRKEVMGQQYEDLYCQFPAGHADGLSDEPVHSWEAIRGNDDLLLHGVRQLGFRSPESIVADLIEGIEAGEYDDWLEAILSAGHDRKRARRGVRGFRRRDR